MAYLVFILFAFFASTIGHSQMRCAKYDIATGVCHAGIRNEGYAFMQEAYEISSGLPICQFPMSNPISSYYSNGAACPDWAPCPNPMGTFQQGENFTVMWLARNHAVQDQNPNSIFIYLSPLETETQGTDFDKSTYSLFCQAPYMSCNGQNGNFVQCYATCQMPANAAVGIHTLWWKWPWQSSVYSTCADITVTAAASSSAPASSSTSSTSARPAQTSTSSSSTSSSSSTTSRSTSTSTSSSTSSSSSSTSSRPTSTSTSSTTAKPAIPSTTGKAVQASTSTSARAPVPSTSTSTSTSSSNSETCNLGDMKCISSNQYQSCAQARVGTYWAPAQSCQTGLSCHPSATANNIYCY